MCPSSRASSSRSPTATERRRVGVHCGPRDKRGCGYAQKPPELHGPDDLAYLWIELADENGTVDAASDDRVTVSVSGPGMLAGLGSAAPSTLENFVDDVRTTHRGRAIAIVRGTEEDGEVTVRVTSERHGEASLSLSSTGARGTEATVAAATRKEAS